jgi:translation initiation factor 2B subunit (eIF-2B alpha/beta/delta family)
MLLEERDILTDSKASHKKSFIFFSEESRPKQNTRHCYSNLATAFLTATVVSWGKREEVETETKERLCC